MAFILLLCVCIISFNSIIATPYGFVAVRGKKADSDYDPRQDVQELSPEMFDDHQDVLPYENKLLAEYLANLDSDQARPWDGFHTYAQYKRTPNGFVGVRGKRAASSLAGINII